MMFGWVLKIEGEIKPNSLRKRLSKNAFFMSRLKVETIFENQMTKLFLDNSFTRFKKSQAKLVKLNENCKLHLIMLLFIKLQNLFLNFVMFYNES
jgi:hypothetical protein